ncbi:hypothetical protein [Williamsia herbipolensis]|uniref:hypothetical protein n=1 Tax=Williamsia herbipolensis TaxID=1603258 RepID=UPI001364CE43|nr:hypothetical protein [Williamsia herbipolensis]
MTATFTTVGFMRGLEKADWTALQTHVIDRNWAPPKQLLVLVAAVIGDPKKIEAGICHAEMANDSSTWSSWVVTPRTLGHVSVTFGTPRFDMSASESRPNPAQTIHKAGVVRLSDVTSLEILGAEHRDDGFDNSIALQGVKLYVSPGGIIELPAQEDIRDTAFFEAIRNGSGL